MAFTSRTEIEIVTIGAAPAEAELRKLAAAEGAVGSTADKASASRSKMATATDATRRAARAATEEEIRERIAIQDAEKAIVDKIRAEQAHKKAIEDTLAGVKDEAEQLGTLAKAGQLASGGLSLLRKAAELIPGMELGTIFAAAAAGVYALYKALGPSTEAVDAQRYAMDAAAISAKNLAAANRDLVQSQVKSGGAAVTKVLERVGPGLTPEARDEIIRLAALRAQVEQERAAAIERQTRKVGGLVPVSDAEQARIDELQAKRDEIVTEAFKRDENGRLELSIKEIKRERDRAQAVQNEINRIKDEATKASGWTLGELIDQKTAELRDLDKKLVEYGSAEAEVEKRAPKASAKTERNNFLYVTLRLPNAGDVDVFRDSLAWVKGALATYYADLEEEQDARFASIRAGIKRRQEDARAEGEQDAEFEKTRQGLARMRSLNLVADDSLSKPPSLLSMLTASNDDRERFEADMKAASAGMKSVWQQAEHARASGVGMLNDFGEGMSKAAAAALLSKGSFRDMAREMLEALTLQAAGQAIWETAQGIGMTAVALFPGPQSAPAAASATAHFEAAAMYAAIGVAAYAGSRMAGTGGSSGSATTHAATAAGTSQFQNQGQQPNVTVQVNIGGRLVARVVDRENADRARRDGADVQVRSHAA